MIGLIFIAAAVIVSSLSFAFMAGVRMLWRALRRAMIGHRLRDLLRCGAKADLAAKVDRAPISQGEIAAAWAATQKSGAYVSPYTLASAREPGRQAIAIPRVADVFGRSTWAGLLPVRAHDAPWEDCHTFPKGGRPTRDVFGLHGDPPLALVCPACDLAQPPMQEDARTCGYCGLKIRRHGSRLYWWRDQTEATAWPKALPKPEAGQ